MLLWNLPCLERRYCYLMVVVERGYGSIQRRETSVVVAVYCVYYPKRPVGTKQLRNNDTGVVVDGGMYHKQRNDHTTRTCFDMSQPEFLFDPKSVTQGPVCYVLQPTSTHFRVLVSSRKKNHLRLNHSPLPGRTSLPVSMDRQ